MLEISSYEGKTREDAIKKCLEDLNTTEDQLYIKEKETEGGLFKSKKVVIDVITHDQVLEYVRNYIKELSENMQLEINSEVNYHDDTIKVTLASDNNAILIGKDGRTLNSIQTLLRQSVNTNTGCNVRIQVDASGYKAKKEHYLEHDVREIARQVSKTGVEAKLDPMNSYDRRIVHNVVGDFEDLTSESFGEEPARYVVISKKD